MTAFVLDNSVAMRWLLASHRLTDQNYAEAVLESMTEARAIVPNLWHLEAANVLLGATARREIQVGEAGRFTVQLERLPIDVDTSTASQAFSHTMSLARAYKLSSYDAAYLELALRENVPVATLDQALVKAAKKAGIAIYLK